MEKAFAVLAILCLLFASCASGPGQKGNKKDSGKKNASVTNNSGNTKNADGTSRNYNYDNNDSYSSNDDNGNDFFQSSDSSGKTKKFKFAPTVQQVVEVGAGVTLTAPYLIFLLRKLLFRR